jgi:hypothetical protein
MMSYAPSVSRLRQSWCQTKSTSPTCFQQKQVTRSRRVFHAVFIIPSVFWHNRQIIAHLNLRSKPRNCRVDFESQITKSQLPILWPKSGNPKSPIMRLNREKPSTLILRLIQETRPPHLLVYGADRTQCHPTSWSSGYRVPDMCLTISTLSTRSPIPVMILVIAWHVAFVTCTPWDK